MVRASVAPPLRSAMVTPAKGFTAASEFVVWPETVPAIVGATVGSLSVTLVALSVVAVAEALLLSLRAKVVVEEEPGAPAFGVNIRAFSALVIAAAVPDSE